MNEVQPRLGVGAGQPSAASGLKERAQALEAAFLAEMLRHAGLASGQGQGFHALRGGLGGGIGEEQFGSFLREAMAGQMARAGGIGLAEALFRAMETRAE